MAMKSIISSPLSAAVLFVAAVVLICTINDSLLMADAAGEPGTAALFLARSAAKACSGKKGGGKFTAAADIRVFNQGKACGQRFEVTCAGAGCKKGKKVEVKIVDRCEPQKGTPCQTLSLSREALAAIGNRKGGVVSITFEPVE